MKSLPKRLKFFFAVFFIWILFFTVSPKILAAENSFNHVNGINYEPIVKLINFLNDKKAELEIHGDGFIKTNTIKNKSRDNYSQGVAKKTFLLSAVLNPVKDAIVGKPKKYAEKVFCAAKDFVFPGACKEGVSQDYAGATTQEKNNNEETSALKKQYDDAIVSANELNQKFNLLQQQLAKVKAGGVIVKEPIIEQKTVERTIEKIVSGISQEDLSASIASIRTELNNLNNNLANQINNLSSNTSRQSTAAFQAISLTNKIDSLSGTRLSGITVNGVSGLTNSDIPDDITASNYLPLIGGTLAGALNGTALSLSGQIDISGTATSTIAGDTNFDSGTLYVDSINNRVGIASSSPSEIFSLNGPAYFSQVSAPSNTVDRLYNTTGDLYWNGNLIGSASVGNWTAVSGNVYRASGNVGIGTTSPNWKLSVAGIGSFDDNVRASYFTATSTAQASIFPYASTTALTVSGDSWFNGLSTIANLILTSSTTLQNFTANNSTTTNATTTNLAVSGTATISSLNGPLQANNGLVSATTSIGYQYGGTGLTSIPSFGQMLRGTGSGYTLVATSTLGINTSDLTEGSNLFWTNDRFDNRLSATTTLPNLTTLANLSITGSQVSNLNTLWDNRMSATTTLPNLTTLANLASIGTITTGVWNGSSIGDAYINNDITLDNLTQITNRAISDTTGTLSVARGGTGQTSFGQGWLNSDGTTMSASTSPTVNYITATSTTATSTFAGGLSIAGHCVTGDTRLRRRRKKKNGAYEYDEVAIKDIQPGDEIASLDEETGKIVWSKVNALMDMGVKEIYHLKTADGRQIRTTATHPYLVKDAGNRPQKHDSPIPGAGWLTVENIRVGDYVVAPKPRAGVFIDNANIFYAQKRSGWKVDFLKFKNLLAKDFDIKVFNYYAATPDNNDPSFSATDKFLQKISQFAALKVKPLKYIEIARGKYEKKGDMDVDLSLDVRDAIDDLDVIIVASGDSDLVSLRDRVLKHAGKKFVFAGFKHNTAWEIKDGKYLEFEKIREVVELGVENKTTPELAPGRTLLSLLYSANTLMSSLDRDKTDAIWARVESIEKVGEEQVYDIEVEGTHNFIGNDIVAHNTYIGGTASSTNLIISNNSALGTVSSGLWNGASIAPQYGGTGQNFSASSGLINLYSGTASAMATSSLGLLTTDVAEGINQYWTNTRFDNRLSATTTLPNLTTLANLSSIGTITSGLWNGSSIGDAYINDDITLTNLTQITNRAISDTTGTLTVARGGTGQTSFGQGWLNSDGTTLSASTSPTVNYITATSTTATSTFAGGLSIAGHCVTGDTRLRRRRKKKNGAYEYDEVAIKDIQPGDEIASLDEETGKIVWSKVNALMDMGIKRIYKLTTAGGKTIRTTAEHPYLVKNKEILAKKAIAFIDYANIKAWLRDKKLSIDLELLIKTLVSAGVSDARFYYGSDSEKNSIHNFFKKLRSFGYTVITKPIQYFKVSLSYLLKQKTNRLLLGSISSAFEVSLEKEALRMDKENISLFAPKANFDVEISVDAIKKSENIDVFVLFSGDGDFAYLLKELKLLGKKTVVVSGRKSLSGALVAEADKFVTLERLSDKLPGLVWKDKNAKPARRQVLKNCAPNIADLLGLSNCSVDNLANAENGLWKKVIYLKKGMEIAVSDMGSDKVVFEKITQIDILPEEQVYDIEVEGTHNFIGNDIVAHNTYIGGTASSTNLIVSNSSALGTVSSGLWNGSSIGDAYINDDITLTNLTQITNRAISDTTGTLTVARGGTGQTSFGQGWLNSDGTTMSASTSPTVNYITATSTTATSTFAGGLSVSGTAGLTVLQNGYVGIGTATPLDPLHVAQSVVAGGTASIILESVGNRTWQIGAKDSSESGAFILYDATASARRLTVDNNGNVGIGINAPAARLHSLSTTEQLRLGYNASNYWSSTVGSTGGLTLAGTGTGGALTLTPTAGQNLNVNLSTTGDFAVNTNQLFVDTSAGNVGIGTVSPSQKLHIVSPSASQALLLETDQAIDTTLDAFRIFGASSGSSPELVIRQKRATAAGDRNVQFQVLQAGTARALSLQPDGGNVGIGTTSPNWKLSVTGIGSFDDYARASYFTATSTTASAFPYASTTALTVSGSTYLGSLTGALQAINGLVSATSSLSSAFIEDAYLKNNADDTTTGQLTATNFVASSDVATSTFAGGLAVETSGLVYNYSTNRVGVGTASPDLKLHILSETSAFPTTSGTVQTGGVLRFQNSDSNAVLDIGQNGGNGAWLQVTAKTDLSQKYALLLNPNGGNIGIGTTSPYAKLSVEGSSALGNSALAGYFTATSTTATSTFAGGVSVAGTTGLTVLQNGNVGVGEVGPGSILSVAKEDSTAYTSSASGAYVYSPYPQELQIKNTATGVEGSFTGLFFYAGDTTEGVSINSARISAVRSGGAATHLTFGTRNSGGSFAERVRIQQDGYVGIGTTTPSAKLDVYAGNIDIDSTTNANQFGVITKNGTRFIHDFNYGNNGTVTTIGGNTFVGKNTGNLTMGSTAIATYEGSYNTAIGQNSLFTNTTGYSNTANGYQSLYSNTTGNKNTASGYTSLYNNTEGNSNSAYGYNSLASNTTGNYNTAIGHASLASNTTSNSNTAVGYASLYSTTGAGNIGYGHQSLYYNTTGSYNIAIGHNSGGVGLAVDNRSVIDNYATFLGYQASRDASVASTTALTNITAIGKNARVGASNTIVLGGTGADAVNVGIGTTTPWRMLSVTGTVGFDGLTGATGAGSLCLDSNKQVVYNSASDACLSSTRATKNSIVNLSLDGLSVLNQLQPSSFIYNQGDGRTRYGFIAEDTALVDDRLATHNENGEITGIDDRAILSVAVKAIKEMNLKISDLQASVALSSGQTTDSLFSWILSKFSAIGIIFGQDKLGAKKGVFDGLEMKDATTGEDYCVKIRNGEWEKTKGTCGETSISSSSVSSSASSTVSSSSSSAVSSSSSSISTSTESSSSSSSVASPSNSASSLSSSSEASSLSSSSVSSSESSSSTSSETGSSSSSSSSLDITSSSVSSSSSSSAEANSSSAENSSSSSSSSETSSSSSSEASSSSVSSEASSLSSSVTN